MEVAREPAASGLVRAVVGAFGVTMVVLGLWAWLAPVANTLHAVNHGIDLTLGGHVGARPALAGFSSWPP